MTTIATDGDTMAADGLMSGNGTVFSTEEVKLVQLKDGRIAGVCGSCYNAAPFLEWLEVAGDKPELTDDFEALVLMADGSCRSYDHKLRWIPVPVPTATGSGMDFALGAMAVGASPEEAVKAACNLDTGSGGKVTVMSRPRKLRRVA